MTKNTSKTIFLLMVAITAVLSFQLLTPNSVFAGCVTSNDCQPSRLYGGQFCQNNSLYQSKITYTCINSTCVSSQQPYLIQTCSGTNNQCVEGLWYTGCTAGTGTTNTTNTNTTNTNTNYPSQCYANSYKKCVGNDSYWFDSCNVQQGIAQKCSATEICQSGGCYTNQVVYNSNYQVVYNTNNTTTKNTTNTTYVNHFSKGCQNNIVYWYDTAGNKNDIYQNCSYSGQMCQDGKCIADPSPKPVVAAKPATTTTTTASATKCETGEELVETCVSTEKPKDDSNNTQVTEQNISLDTNSGTAAVSESKPNLLMEFLNKWYVWIIVGIILIIFFVIVFVKSSSKVEGRVQKKQ